MPIFPRSKPAPLNLRPERRVGEKQRRVPAQMIHGAIFQIDKAVAQLTKKTPGLSALADSAVDVAILTYPGRSELQFFFHRGCMNEHCSRLCHALK